MDSFQSPYYGWIVPYEWQEPEAESDLDPEIDDEDYSQDEFFARY